MSAGFGKCIDILHVIGDTLYNMDKPSVRPKLGPPEPSNKKPNNTTLGKTASDIQTTVINEINEISDDIDNVNITETNDHESEDEIAKDDTESNSIPDECTSQNVIPETLDPVQEMDKLLEYCFLKACKTTLKKEDLPMITSTVFKNHVIVACPPGTTVDVKKSSYKKLSVFLASMKEKGLVGTSVLKGVESLLAVKVSQPLYFPSLSIYIILKNSVHLDEIMFYAVRSSPDKELCGNGRTNSKRRGYFKCSGDI